jgi:hypothetical protein
MSIKTRLAKLEACQELEPIKTIVLSKDPSIAMRQYIQLMDAGRSLAPTDTPERITLKEATEVYHRIMG